MLYREKILRHELEGMITKVSSDIALRYFLLLAGVTDPECRSYVELEIKFQMDVVEYSE